LVDAFSAEIDQLLLFPASKHRFQPSPIMFCISAIISLAFKGARLSRKETLPERSGDTSEEAAQSGGFQERWFGLLTITNGDGDLYPSRDGRDGRGRHEQE